MVDAFFTRRGLPILEDESYSEKGFSENVDKRNTSWSYGTGKEGEITAAGIYKMYCNREPRFIMLFLSMDLGKNVRSVRMTSSTTEKTIFVPARLMMLLKMVIWFVRVFV